MPSSTLFAALVLAVANGAVWDCDKQTSCASCTGLSHLLDESNPQEDVRGDSRDSENQQAEAGLLGDDELGTQLIGCNWCPFDNSCE